MTVMPRSYGMNSFFFPMYGYGMGGYGGYSYFGFTSFFNLIFLATMAYFVISFVQGMFGGADTDEYGMLCICHAVKGAGPASPTRFSLCHSGQPQVAG